MTVSPWEIPARERSQQRQQQSGERALLASHPHWPPKAVGMHRRNACPSCLVNTSMHLLYPAWYQQELDSQCQDIWARAKSMKLPPHNIGREETEISTWRAGASIYFLYLNTEILLGPCIMLCLCTKAKPSFYMQPSLSVKSMSGKGLPL